MRLNWIDGAKLVKKYLIWNKVDLTGTLMPKLVLNRKQRGCVEQDADESECDWK